MVLIGTSGHVDHGKSTLVEALTGTNPMHLPEEKARELTIELGFARLEHPDGYTLSIVDVPGHERLVRTMVSGATGFQLALWVVDAREGLMPQSLEHFDVLRLLGTPFILPVITKADIATESEIHETAAAIQRQFKRMKLPERPAQIVDSISGRGIPELKTTIFDACRQLRSFAPPQNGANTYLPIDRRFTLKGVGTVVTGTLIRGVLREGDCVTISSNTEMCRIRSLHNHNAQVESVAAGHRVGVQLHGIKVGQIRRGDTLVSQDYPYRSRRLNVEFHFLEEAPFRWKTGIRALFLAAAFEQECRLWGMIQSSSGRIWVQIQLPEEACFYRGQRFILRSTNPLTTIGGGTILDTHPDRPRRITEPERKMYETDLHDPRALEHYVESAKYRILNVSALETKWMLDKDRLEAVVARSANLKLASARIDGRDTPLLWHKTLDGLAAAAIGQIAADSRDSAKEIPLKALSSTLRIQAHHMKPYIESFLASDLGAAFRQAVRIGPNTLRVDVRQGAPSNAESKAAAELTRRLKSDGIRPARLKDYTAACQVDEKTFNKVVATLLKEGLVVRIDNDFVLDAGTWDAFADAVRRASVDGFTPSEFGAFFGLSRKFSMPYLVALARVGIVKRQGDRHVIVRPTKGFTLN